MCVKIPYNTSLSLPLNSRPHSCSEHEVHGRHLLELSQEDLKEMGIK